MKTKQTKRNSNSNITSEDSLTGVSTHTAEIGEANSVAKSETFSSEIAANAGFKLFSVK